MGKLFRLTLCFVLISAAGAANRGPSTPQERTRLIKAADLMQNKPLTPEASKEGMWGVQWITDVPDINVTICGALSPGYKYEPQLMASQVLAMGAFIVKNPKKASDQNAVWRAGVDGMLNTYQSIIRKQPNASDEVYDDILEQRSEDDLVSFMHEYGLHCYSSGGSRSIT